jgi:hypothetical protein
VASALRTTSAFGADVDDPATSTAATGVSPKFVSTFHYFCRRRQSTAVPGSLKAVETCYGKDLLYSQKAQPRVLHLRPAAKRVSFQLLRLSLTREFCCCSLHQQPILRVPLGHLQRNLCISLLPYLGIVLVSNNILDLAILSPLEISTRTSSTPFWCHS